MDGTSVQGEAIKKVQQGEEPMNQLSGGSRVQFEGGGLQKMSTFHVKP